MKNPLIALLLSWLPLFTATCQPSPAVWEGKPLLLKQKLPLHRTLQTIAFGSCNRVDKDQEMWAAISQNHPDLWIWLGDNIYADTDDMQAMKSMYLQQKYTPAYQTFIRQTPVIGIWDDHDYGVNDGDKNYPHKVESQQLMLDFLDVPSQATVRKQAGAYQSYTFGRKGQQVKVILLDGRYFRDELRPGPVGSGIRYAVNPTGDMLGEAQWQWLEKELTHSEAQIHIIGCGIQILAEEQKYEKWANFPAARTRLLQLLDQTRPAGAFLISGDRHIAELCHYTLPESGQSLYELTSSGLTHTWSFGSGAEEPNAYRVGDLIIARNFGLLYIDWSGSKPTLRVEVRGLENKRFLNQPIPN